ncbi:hypothetical protein [Paenibacillus sp.]|uniref:hypothetical protein n=1 Tax=Paenibacillus sp. TaxID=58172 RepID=UPI00281279F4|nr:hypothetical protein [Paenibacillus sp.]
MSLREMQAVPGEWLERRIEEVRELEASETERYGIVKDEETGEHYLHYRYIHRDVAAGGAESAYHQLMPLETDEVLDLMFNGAAYRYPEAWRRAYLRNGPNDQYVWFDPAPTLEADEGEREAERIRRTLLEFKRQGSYDPQDVERLLRELDSNED